MNAKEFVMEIIVNRVKELEDDIKRLSEILAEKKDELERLSNFLESESKKRIDVLFFI